MNGILKVALGYAEDASYIKKNLCKSRQLVLPKEKKKEIVILDQTEVANFVQACREHPNGLILEVGLELGCRVSEYSALRWQDVDFTNRTVRINQSVFYSKGGK